MPNNCDSLSSHAQASADMIRTMFIATLLIILALTGCTHFTYDIANYENSLYHWYEHQDARGLDVSIEMLEQSIVSAEMVHASIPRGVYGDFGVLLALQGQLEKSFLALHKESTNFPESKLLMDKLATWIQRGDVNLTGIPAQPVKPETLPPIERGITYRKFFERNPRTILIAPPINQTVKAHASAAVQLTAIAPLIEQGYYPFPFLVTSLFFAHLLLNEQASSPIEHLLLQSAKSIGADAVLYITISEWQQGNPPFTFASKVTAEYRLLDTESGHVLWNRTAQGEAEEIFDNMSYAGANFGVIGGGIMGALGGVQRTILDPRRPARELNGDAIRAEVVGLPAGIYNSNYMKDRVRYPSQ